MQSLVSSAKLLLIAITGLATTSILAVNPKSSQSQHKRFWSMNRIVYPISAGAWVNTHSANVTVSINATVAGDALARTQQQIIKSLDGVAQKAKWHITSLSRSQTGSGLEQLQMVAEARMPLGALTNLRPKLKKFNKSGLKYTLANMDFSASNAQLEKIKAKLRDKIYQKIAKEIDRVNKVYPKQTFSVHAINFGHYSAPMYAMNAMKQRSNSLEGGAAPSSVAVGNKMTLNATVVLGSEG